MYAFFFFILVNFVIMTSKTLKLPVLCWFFVNIVKYTSNKHLDSLVYAVEDKEKYLMLYFLLY